MLFRSTFKLDGSIISTTYLNYLLFITYDEEKYVLNIINLYESQHNLLYASIRISIFESEDMENAIIHCLRLRGRVWILIVVSKFIKYYLFEPNTYITVNSPKRGIKVMEISAVSSFSNDIYRFNVTYNVKDSAKLPHNHISKITIPTLTRSIKLPLRSYITGFDVEYFGQINNNTDKCQPFSLKQFRINNRMETPTDQIISVYKSSENVISVVKKPYENIPLINQYVFSKNSYSVSSTFKIAHIISKDDLIDVVQSYFKKIPILIFIGKDKHDRYYNYSIIEFSDQIYNVRSVITWFKAKYLALDSNNNYLILHNRETRELLKIDISNNNSKFTKLILNNNCSYTVFHDSVCGFKLLFEAHSTGKALQNLTSYVIIIMMMMMMIVVVNLFVYVVPI